MDFTINNKAEAQLIVRSVNKNPERAKELTQDERKIVLKAVEMLQPDSTISSATVSTKTQISGYDVKEWKHTENVIEKFIVSYTPEWIVNLFKGIGNRVNARFSSQQVIDKCKSVASQLKQPQSTAEPKAGRKVVDTTQTGSPTAPADTTAAGTSTLAASSKAPASELSGRPPVNHFAELTRQRKQQADSASPVVPDTSQSPVAPKLQQQTDAGKAAETRAKAASETRKQVITHPPAGTTASQAAQLTTPSQSKPAGAWGQGRPASTITTESSGPLKMTPAQRSAMALGKEEQIRIAKRNDALAAQDQAKEAKAKAKAETDAKVRAEAEAKAKADADAKTKVEAEAKAKADARSKAANAAEARAEAPAAPKTGQLQAADTAAVDPSGSYSLSANADTSWITKPTVSETPPQAKPSSKKKVRWADPISETREFKKTNKKVQQQTDTEKTAKENRAPQIDSGSKAANAAEARAEAPAASKTSRESDTVSPKKPSEQPRDIRKILDDWIPLFLSQKPRHIEIRQELIDVANFLRDKYPNNEPIPQVIENAVGDVIMMARDALEKPLQTAIKEKLREQADIHGLESHVEFVHEAHTRNMDAQTIRRMYVEQNAILNLASTLTITDPLRKLCLDMVENIELKSVFESESPELSLSLISHQKNLLEGMQYLERTGPLYQMFERRIREIGDVLENQIPGEMSSTAALIGEEQRSIIHSKTRMEPQNRLRETLAAAGWALNKPIKAQERLASQAEVKDTIANLRTKYEALHAQTVATLSGTSIDEEKCTKIRKELEKVQSEIAAVDWNDDTTVTIWAAREGAPAKHAAKLAGKTTPNEDEVFGSINAMFSEAEAFDTKALQTAQSKITPARGHILAVEEFVLNSNHFKTVQKASKSPGLTPEAQAMYDNFTIAQKAWYEANTEGNPFVILQTHHALCFAAETLMSNAFTCKPASYWYGTAATRIVPPDLKTEELALLKTIPRDIRLELADAKSYIISQQEAVLENSSTVDALGSLWTDLDNIEKVINERYPGRTALPKDVEEMVSDVLAIATEDAKDPSSYATKSELRKKIDIHNLSDHVKWLLEAKEKNKDVASLRQIYLQQEHMLDVASKLTETNPLREFVLNLVDAIDQENLFEGKHPVLSQALVDHQAELVDMMLVLKPGSQASKLLIALALGIADAVKKQDEEEMNALMGLTSMPRFLDIKDRVKSDKDTPLESLYTELTEVLNDERLQPTELDLMDLQKGANLLRQFPEYPITLFLSKFKALNEKLRELSISNDLGLPNETEMAEMLALQQKISGFIQELEVLDNWPGSV